MTRVRAGGGGREGERKSTREREVEKTEIQFERCMLDPLAGPAHFEIGFVLLQIRFALRVVRRARSSHSWKPDTEREGGKEEKESRGKMKGLRVTCVGRNLSFVPPTLSSPFPRPAPALSPLVLLVAAAAASLYTRRCSFRRCCYRLSAVCTGDSSSAQLMEVTKVEVVPSFKVAISGSRVSRARYTR